MMGLQSFLCCLILSLSSIDAKTVTIKGAGASFPSGVYTQWLNDYRTYRANNVDVRISYESIGSGAGRARIKGEQLPTVDFAGSDIALTKQEQEDYPDLIMFPTLAGAIVMAYDIPGCDSLILSMGTIVGIYNGSITYWDDLIIKLLNPENNLPHELIVPIARSDKSGTTAAFTSGMASHSPEWNNNYGSFSAGLGSDREPIHWNSSVVKFFGNTNRGMSSLIMSLPYSVGYISIEEASISNLPIATMRNQEGYSVNASVSTVQSAILVANGSYNIMDMPGKTSWPLASFTYIIVRKTEMTECDTAVELIRYLNWCLASKQAKELAESSHMIPLADGLIKVITAEVLNIITCKGTNVWKLLEAQIIAENTVTEDVSWKVPSFLGIGVLILVIMGMLSFFAKQQYKLHSELLANTWFIPSSKINIEKKTVQETMRIINLKNSRSVIITPSTPTHRNIMNLEQAWTEEFFKIGVYEEGLIALFKLGSFQNKMTIKTKRDILWMRDRIQHTNLMPFMGISKSQTTWYTVHSGQVRGTLSDILVNPKIKTDSDGRCIIELIKGIVSGLKYLHKKGIIHGHFKGSCCLVDMTWNVRIAAWVEAKLFSLNQNYDKSPSEYTTDTNDELAVKMLFWTAPELLRYKQQTSTYAADVYSFGMVLQEMFSKQDLYIEYDMTPNEIINSIIAFCIRPRFHSTTPVVFRELMDKLWDMDPIARPSFTTIEHIIKAAYPKKTSVLDCIIESTEEYANLLERKIKDRDEELETMTTRTQGLLYQSVPDCIVDKLILDQKVDNERFEQVTVLSCTIPNLHKTVTRVTLNGISHMLNNIYTGLDQLLLGSDTYNVNTQAGTFVYAVGVPIKNKQHAKRACETAIKILKFIKKYSKEQLQGIGTEIGMKIGIASGEVVTSVTGKVVPRYTIIGKTLDTAAALMSTAQINTILVSKTTYLLLKDSHSIHVRCLQVGQETRYILDNDFDQVF